MSEVPIKRDIFTFVQNQCAKFMHVVFFTFKQRKYANVPILWAAQICSLEIQNLKHSSPHKNPIIITSNGNNCHCHIFLTFCLSLSDICGEKRGRQGTARRLDPHPHLLKTRNFCMTKMERM